jgi:hypothetical protein
VIVIVVIISSSNCCTVTVGKVKLKEKVRNKKKVIIISWMNKFRIESEMIKIDQSNNSSNTIQESEHVSNVMDFKQLLNKKILSFSQKVIYIIQYSARIITSKGCNTKGCRSRY